MSRLAWLLLFAQLTACAPERLVGTPSLDAAVVAPEADAGADAGSVDSGVMERDSGGPEPIDGGSDAGAAAETDGGISARCFSAVFDPARPGPEYDQFQPIVGKHCMGTNHQAIEGIERVVFLGDSVTVGTPPTSANDTYRSRLADALAARFQIQPPSLLWKSTNPISGLAGTRFSGAFASCAKFGARTDDLWLDHSQIDDCFPADQRAKRTLVVMTVGGNDLASLQKDGVHRSYQDNFKDVSRFVGLLRQTLVRLKDRTVFTGGVDVVFANLFEFTDATGDVSSCPAAAIAGFTSPWDHPEDLERLVIWANEQYLQMAVETGSDMVFMLEHFCGHGFHSDDPGSRCYRGPDTPRWFDFTCIHPSPAGHAALEQMLLSTVSE